MELNVGDRIRIKEYEFKDRIGTVLMVHEEAIIVVDIDGFSIPVATIIDNIEKI